MPRRSPRSAAGCPLGRPTQGVVATGISAARSHGLPLSVAGDAEAYVTAAVAKKLTEQYFLVASERGNLLLRTVGGTWHTDTAVQRHELLVATRLITAVDLLGSTDVRSATAGRELLLGALRSLSVGEAIRS